jgi:hypothetical protein
VAERVGADVDAAGEQSITLLGRERAVVPDDVRDRIRHRAKASSRRIVQGRRIATAAGKVKHEQAAGKVTKIAKASAHRTSKRALGA